MFINTIINLFPRRLHEFLRYCIVGSTSTAIDAIVFYFLNTFVSYQIALIVGSLVGKVYSYFFTIYWAFHAKSNVKNAIGMVAAHIFNLFVVRMGTMWVFVSLLGISENIAYIYTMIVSGVTNFVIMKFVAQRLK